MRRKLTSRIQQSDIVISPKGDVHISFLWRDLSSIAGIEVKLPQRSSSWEVPHLSTSFNFHEYENCQLCPKACGMDRTRYTHPTCGDEKLRVSNFGISSGDEPEIRGRGGSGIIMLSGCPLTCPSCHNPEKVQFGRETSLLDFLNICKDLFDQGAENLQILSPTVHLPVLRQILLILKQTNFPLPIVFKSSGYESVEELKKLHLLVDIYLPDFKFGPCSSWGKRAGVEDYFDKASLALKEMHRQVGHPQYDQNGVMMRGLLVRHVLAPLPKKEREALLMHLNTEDMKVSLQDSFVVLD